MLEILNFTEHLNVLPIKLHGFMGKYFVYIVLVHIAIVCPGSSNLTYFPGF